MIHHCCCLATPRSLCARISIDSSHQFVVLPFSWAACHHTRHCRSNCCVFTFPLRALHNTYYWFTQFQLQHCYHLIAHRNDKCLYTNWKPEPVASGKVAATVASQPIIVARTHTSGNRKKKQCSARVAQLPWNENAAPNFVWSEPWQYWIICISITIHASNCATRRCCITICSYFTFWYNSLNWFNPLWRFFTFIPIIKSNRVHTSVCVCARLEICYYYCCFFVSYFTRNPSSFPALLWSFADELLCSETNEEAWEEENSNNSQYNIWNSSAPRQQHHTMQNG